MQTMKTTLDNRIATLETQLNDANTELSNSTRQNESLKEELQSAVLNSENLAEELLSRNNQYVTDTKSLSDKLTTTESKLNESLQENTRLSEHISTLMTKFERERGDLEQSIMGYETKCRDLEIEVAKQSELVADLKDELEDMCTSKDFEVTKLQSDLNVLKTSTDEVILALGNDKLELVAKKDELEQRVENLVESNLNYHMDMEELKSKLEQVEQDRESQPQIDELNAQIKSLEETLSTTSDQVTSKWQQVLMSERVRYENTIRTQESIMKRLEGELEDAKRKQKEQEEQLRIAATKNAPTPPLITNPQSTVSSSTGTTIKPKPIQPASAMFRRISESRQDVDLSDEIEVTQVDIGNAISNGNGNAAQRVSDMYTRFTQSVSSITKNTKDDKKTETDEFEFAPEPQQQQEQEPEKQRKPRQPNSTKKSKKRSSTTLTQDDISEFDDTQSISKRLTRGRGGGGGKVNDENISPITVGILSNFLFGLYKLKTNSLN